jgi:hypothetical protein
VRLGVAQHVRGGLVELPGREREVLVDEDVLPGHEHVVEHDQRVRLVEARGQRIVEHAGRGAGVGPSSVQLEAGRVVGYDYRDGVVLVAGAQRQDHRDEHPVRHHAAGGEHLRPANDDAAVALGRRARVQEGLRLLVGGLCPVDRRLHDGVAEIEILVGRLRVEAQQVVGELLAVAGEELRRAGEAGEEGGDVIGRAAEEAIRGVGPALDRLPPGGEVLARARHQPGLVDGPAVARRGIRHQRPIRRIVGDVVEVGERAYGGGEGRVIGDVLDTLAVEEHRAAIAQPAYVVRTTPCHAAPPSAAARAGSRPRSY